ncbi:MAG: GMC family oxidoreductase [Bacteroidales bacterium]|nr:GMC family oxidoreductase [Bacteroidales bacterium]
MHTDFFDYIIIGSGFGGSVAAMRLSEKGYKVLVIEKGKRFESKDFPKSDWNLKKFLWIPSLKFKGILQLSFFRQMFILSGTGVGGGSLVYANALMEPSPTVFKDKGWIEGQDWCSSLQPFFKKASKMLGSVPYNKMADEDLALLKIAQSLGKEDTFSTINVGINLEETNSPKDPYFEGLGPLRNSCNGCAGCMTGCHENAKNSLDKNYLFFAEKNGVKILPETKAIKIEFSENQYSIHTASPFNRFRTNIYRSKGIIVSAGVLGTLELLLKQKYKFKTLPLLSPLLGHQIRTNSQSISGIVNADRKLNNGPAITSIFSPTPNTHIELVKFNDQSGSVTHLSGFACEDPSPSVRAWKQLFLTIQHPVKFLRLLFMPRWCKNSIVLLVMQTTDSAMKMIWRRNLLGGGIRFHKDNKRVPAFIPEGQDILHRLSKETGATAMNSIAESLFNMATTAHIIGGCPMGVSSDSGVVDHHFHVHQYPEMYILDSSVIPCNLGVNPSLTITAISEYACSHIQEKPGNQRISLEEQIAMLKK